jgi:hypothetical protein
MQAIYAPYVTISHENKSAGSIVLIPDLGLNQLKEHVELELTRTFGTFEVNNFITVPIGIDYRQILALKVSAIPQSILRSKTIADTMTDTEKVSAIPPIPILYRDINNPDSSGIYSCIYSSPSIL